VIETLDTCLEEVLSGRKSVEECLGERPEVKSELEPLLTVALAVASLAQDKPPAESQARTQVRLQSQLLARRLRRGKAVSRWFSRALSAAAVVLVLIVAGGGTAVVAASSLPSDTLYPLKLTLEQGELLMARSPQEQAELHVAFAARRLEEIQALESKGKTVKDDLALESLGRDTELGLTLGRDLEEQSKTRLMERIVTLTEQQQSVLGRVLQNAPSSAADKLAEALETSRRGHDVALSVLGKQNQQDGKRVGNDSAENDLKDDHPRELPTNATPAAKPGQQGPAPAGETKEPSGQEQRQNEKGLGDQSKSRKDVEPRSDSTGRSGRIDGTSPPNQDTRLQNEPSASKEQGVDPNLGRAPEHLLDADKQAQRVEQESLQKPATPFATPLHPK